MGTSELFIPTVAILVGVCFDVKDYARLKRQDDLIAFKKVR